MSRKRVAVSKSMSRESGEWPQTPSIALLFRYDNLPTWREGEFNWA